MNKTEENRFCNFTLINLSTPDPPPPPSIKTGSNSKKNRNQKKTTQNNTIPPPYARIFLVAEIHIFSIYDDKAGLILSN